MYIYARLYREFAFRIEVLIRKYYNLIPGWITVWQEFYLHYLHVPYWQNWEIKTHEI